jgi:hypothetical protein
MLLNCQIKAAGAARLASEPTKQKQKRSKIEGQQYTAKQ